MKAGRSIVKSNRIDAKESASLSLELLMGIVPLMPKEEANDILHIVAWDSTEGSKLPI